MLDVEGDGSMVVLNSTGDAGDNDLSDGICDTGGMNSEDMPECTLRAAMEQAGDATLEGLNRIGFDIPTSDPGFVTGVFHIEPTSPLPGINDPLIIDGSTSRIRRTAANTLVSNWARRSADSSVCTGPNSP